MIIISSCSNDEDNSVNNNKSQQAFWVIDENHETDFDASFIDPNKGYIAFISCDDDGDISKVNYIYNDGESLLSVLYDEAGRVQSISGDSITVVFSNYAGNKVDIAIIYKDNMGMSTENETYINWDEQSTRNSKKLQTRGTEWYDKVEEWQRPLYELTEKYGIILNQILNIGKITVGGATGAGDDKIIEWLNDWVKDLRYEAFANVDWPDYEIVNVNLKDFLDNAKGGYDIAKAFKYNLYYGLATLIANYSSYVDLMSDVIYWELEAEEWIRSNVELALGALNSGSGDLKATLTWNFYADIDLHATEPSGAHIYYGNPTSSYSDGFLDVDNRAGGSGATENIYWSNPENGIYEFSIDYYGASTYNYMSQSGNCKVTILYKGVGKVYNISMGEYDYKNVTSITLPTGVYSRATTEAANAIQVRVKVNHKEPKESKCRVIE